MEIEQQAVRRETILPVTRDRAWDALRDADGLSGWLADEVEVEIAAGAEGVVRWRNGEERLVTVEEVEDRRRVVFRWQERSAEPSLVELTLDDVEGGTQLVVVEVPLPALRAIASDLDAAASRPGPQMLSSAPRMLATVA